MGMETFSSVWTFCAVILAIFFSFLTDVIIRNLPFQFRHLLREIFQQQAFRLGPGDKSKALPTQPQDNCTNTQIGGGHYNPQVQGGIKADGGKINMGPEIKEGGSFTINSSLEK